MLYEKLTEDELNIIEIMRHNCCDENSDYFYGSFVDPHEFLRFWETAKAPMLEAFGDRLIVKKPINSVVEDDDLYNAMRRISFMSEYKTFKDLLNDFLQETNGNDWHRRITTGENGTLTSPHDIVNYELCGYESWVSNRYDGPTCEIKIGDGNIIKVTHGCKVMKVLGRMAKACGDNAAELFEILRVRQSQVLNEARMNANLCISIHPLDFMTASYNNNDWRSCMCWEDGEFRRGVIEMMNSPMVVCAYLESKSSTMSWYNGYNMPRLEWNSKRWREFFIVRPDMICGIKGYPYWNRTLEDEVINWLAEMFAPMFNADYTPIVEWRCGKPVQDEKNDIDTYIDMDCGPAMYNDFYGDNLYHARFIKGLHGDNWSGNDTNKRYETSVFYSGESECVVCGAGDASFDSEGDLACSRCVEHIYCTCCGDEIDGTCYEIEGQYYCQYCYEQLDLCSICDERIDTSNNPDTLKFSIGYYDNEGAYATLRTSRDVLREAPEDDELYSEQRILEFSVCKNCAARVFKDGICELHKEHYIYHEDYHYYTIVPIDRLTDFALEHLVDPMDLESFKALHISEAASA